MRLHRAVAVATILAFLVTSSAQTLFAADPHAVSSAQLHQAIQASHAKVTAARQAMDTFLTRTDVQKGIKRIGLEPAQVRQRVAMLGDTEILRLHQQVMSVQQQQIAAGQDASSDMMLLILIVVIVAVLAAVVYWAAYYNSGYYY